MKFIHGILLMSKIMTKKLVQLTIKLNLFMVQAMSYIMRMLLMLCAAKLPSTDGHDGLKSLEFCQQSIVLRMRAL